MLENSTITATVVNGMLKPDQPLGLSEGTQVEVTISPLDSSSDWDRRFEEFLQFSREHPIHSGGLKFTRDELHERD